MHVRGYKWTLFTLYLNVDLYLDSIKAYTTYTPKYKGSNQQTVQDSKTILSINLISLSFPNGIGFFCFRCRNSKASFEV